MFNEFISKHGQNIIAFALPSAVFIYWLIKTSFGRTSLLNAKSRRNDMPLLFPFAAILFWLLSTIILGIATDPLTKSLSEKNRILISNCTQMILYLCVIALILVAIRRHFCRGLIGLGFRFRQLPKDLLYAGIGLFSIQPVMIVVLAITVSIGKLLRPDFDITPHPELQLIIYQKDTLVITTIFINVVIITPVIEELIFRGLFQNIARTYLGRPWPVVFLCSGFFAIFHGDPAHWPAIFVLGALLGYSYEKSGSLLRPIFIHALFNGSVLLLNILAPQPA